MLNSIPEDKIKYDREKREEQKKIRISTEDYNYTRDSVGKKMNKTSGGSNFCC